MTVQKGDAEVTAPPPSRERTNGASTGNKAPTADRPTVFPAHAQVKPRTAGVLEPEAILEEARLLVPRLRERLVETEELRRLPDATFVEAGEAGIYSLLLPRSLGGAGGGLRDFVELVRILAHGHLSAAWTISFLAEHNYMLARYRGELQREVFQDGQYALMSGVIHPPGKGVPVDDGFMLSGYWGYATAVMHADWVQVFGIVEGREDEPLLFLLPRSEVEVQDTWDMSGMRGTGSHHVRVDGKFVPEYRTLELNFWASRENPGSAMHPEPIYSYALRDLLGFMYPAMAVGAAEVMLEEYRQRIERRRQPFSPDLSADTVTGQVRYARSVLALRLAQATLQHTLDLTIQANKDTEEDLTPDQRANFKLGLIGVLRMAWESIEIGLRGSGTSVFKADAATQSYVRDMEMLLSHQTIDEDAMLSKTGEILLGRSTSEEATSAVI